LFSVVLFFQTLFFDFVNFDDNKIKNEVLNTIGGVGKITKVMTMSYGNFFRPLQTASFLIERAIGGESAFIYHLTNLLIHALTCFLIYLLLLKLNYSKKLSLLIGVIYAVHPLFTHSVVWIPSRGDLLLCLFGILSFITFINYIKKSELKNLIIHFLVFFLGLLSKETAIVFPAIFLVYYFIILKKRNISKDLILSTLAWIVAVCIWFYFRKLSLTAGTGDGTVGIDSFIYNLPMFPELISKFIIPINISVLPTFNTIRTITGVIFILGIIYLFIINKTKNTNNIILGFVWFLSFLLPVMVFKLPNASSYYDYLDHRAYLPMLGLIIILIEIVPNSWQQLKNTKIVYGYFLLIALYFILTFFQSRNYINPVTYWNNGISYDGSRAMFRYGLALAYKIQKNKEESKREFLKSLELDSNMGDSYLELGEIYYNDGDFKNAVKYFKRGKELVPGSNLADINLAVAYGSIGQTDESIKHLKNVINVNPNDKDAIYNLIVSYKVSMKFDSALYYAKVLEKLGEKIDYAEFYTNWGFYLQQTGNLNGAIEKTQSALKINQNYPLALSKLGFYFLLGGNKAQGEALIKKALELNPNLVDGYNNLFTYYFMGVKDYPLAARYADEVIKHGGKIDPKQLQFLSKYR
jgi:protein O-mannosyl-transferase